MTDEKTEGQTDGSLPTEEDLTLPASEGIGMEDPNASDEAQTQVQSDHAHPYKKATSLDEVSSPRIKALIERIKDQDPGVAEQLLALDEMLSSAKGLVEEMKAQEERELAEPFSIVVILSMGNSWLTPIRVRIEEVIDEELIEGARSFAMLEPEEIFDYIHKSVTRKFKHIRSFAPKESDHEG